nr:MAG TPA: hypothetical protein [Bacteriophage sp.]
MSFLYANVMVCFCLTFVLKSVWTKIVESR